MTFYEFDQIYQYRVGHGPDGAPRWEFYSCEGPRETLLPSLDGDAADGVIYMDYFPLVSWPGEGGIVALQAKMVITDFLSACKNIPGLPTTWDDYLDALRSILLYYGVKTAPSSESFMNHGDFLYLQFWMCDAEPHILNAVLDEMATPTLNFRISKDVRAYDSKFISPADMYNMDVRFEPVGQTPAEGILEVRYNYSFARCSLYRLITGWDHFVTEPYYAFFTGSHDPRDCIDSGLPNTYIPYRWPRSPDRASTVTKTSPASNYDPLSKAFVSLYKAHTWDAYIPLVTDLTLYKLLSCFNGGAVLGLNTFYCTCARLGIDSAPSAVFKYGARSTTVDMENACICGINNSHRADPYFRYDEKILM